MNNNETALTTSPNPTILRQGTGQIRLTECSVHNYKELIKQQQQLTGESWVYKDKYTIQKKHDQLMYRHERDSQGHEVIILDDNSEDDSVDINVDSNRNDGK